MNVVRTMGFMLLLAIPVAAQTQQAQPVPQQAPGQPYPQQPQPATDARKVTLQEALQLAARQSPDVAAARAQAQIAHAQVERAWTAWQPDVVANGQYDHTNGIAVFDFRPLINALPQIPPGAFGPQPLVITDQNNWYGNLQVSQPLLTPQGLFGPGVAKAGAEAADRGADQAREQILLAVARAYLGLQGYEALLQAARDAEQVAIRREQDARARIAAGTDVEIGLLRAQTETAAARVQISNILGQQQNLLPLLAALVGENIAPVAFGSAPQLGLPAEEGEEPWEASFAVRSAVAQTSAASRAVRLSQFLWLPQVSGVARESYTSNPGFVGKNFTYDLMINASLPIYDRGVRYAQLHEDEAKLTQAQATLAATRARAKADWVGSKANFVAAQAVLDQSIASEQLAARTQQQVEVSARAGVSTSLDLSDADQKKFAAQSAVAQARTVVEIRKAEIAASEGKLYLISHQQ
jgi:outer membrane protein TolC